MANSEATTLTAISRSNERITYHNFSPSITLVAQAESYLGAGNTIGLSSNFTPTWEACSQVQDGTRTTGVLKRRAHALHGLEWCSYIFLKRGTRTLFSNAA